MKILANDGITATAIAALENNGCTVITTKVAQEQVANYINSNQIDVLIVKTATKVTSNLLDSCTTLQLIACTHTTPDTIDVAYAESKNIKIIQATNASANAIAELVFAHLLTGARFLHDSNRNMPLEGDTKFIAMQKSYAHGKELANKTLAIIGVNQAAKSVAQKAIGLGMQVLFANPTTSPENTENPININLSFFDNQTITFSLPILPLAEVLPQAHYVSLHTAPSSNYVLTKKEFDLMPQGVGIVNCSSGSLIHEVDMIRALDHKKIDFVGLDVYQDQPTPAVQVLMHPQISLTPHIGSSTQEVEQKIGIEIANKIIAYKNIETKKS